MTVFAMMELARKAIERGSFDFIAKPFHAEEIRTIVVKEAEASRTEAQSMSPRLSSHRIST